MTILVRGINMYNANYVINKIFINVNDLKHKTKNESNIANANKTKLAKNIKR